MQQLIAHQRGTAAQNYAGNSGAQQTVDHHTVKIVIFAGTHVLTGEGHGCLRKSVHGGINEALKVGGCRAARHHGGAKRVDGGLNDHIGQAEHSALQPGRQADEQDLLQGTGMEAEMAQVKAQCPFFLHQHPGDHTGGDGLADDSGQRHACYAHGKTDDEHQIQHYVDDACRCQTVQRAFGVAHCAQQGGAEVVQHGHRHTDEIDLQVQCRQVDYVLRAAHKLQQAAGCKKADNGQQHTADQPQRDRGLHGMVYAALVSGAKAPGCDDVGTQRKPHEQVDQQIDERTVGAHRCQSGAARESPYHHDVRCIEQQL